MTTSFSPPPIAVVGVSALFPGSVDKTGFWRDILAGRDLIGDVPPTHWLIEDYYDPDPSAPDKTYAKRGAFLDEVAFDPMKFGIPPTIVPATDATQLLGLIVAQRVLEDACRGPFEGLDRERVSVILGVTGGQELLASMVSRLQRPVWTKALREAGLAEDTVQDVCDRIAAEYVPWQESSFPGLLGNVVAGRIANRMDLGGTNCVTDAACASAFSAVSMAVNELYLGQSEMVITGGCDTLNDILMHMCFSKTPALSHSGDCRPFSDQADGTLLGEGLGMVALKRLEDAERAGDHVYAVIRGVGASSDGRAKSVYAPRPEGQAKALRRAYAAAGFGPDTVELVEAHGTATRAGDAAEFEGLRLAFQAEDDVSDRPWCALGSVKSQIGHTKAAAGAGGLFKAVMALHHGVLPPTIKVDRPNPALRMETSPFYLNTQARPWVRNRDHPRRAGVSSFGFGGSNFHIAVEEYRDGPSPRAPRLRTLPDELIIFSAENTDTLLAELRALHLPEDPSEAEARACLQHLAYASQHRASQTPGESSTTVRSADEQTGRAASASKREPAAARANGASHHGATVASAPRDASALERDPSAREPDGSPRSGDDAGRSQRVRLAVVADNLATLRERVGQAIRRIEAAPSQSFDGPGGLFFAIDDDARGADEAVAFLFPGQGSQYVGMGGDVAASYDEALAAWDLAADVAFDEPLHDVVFPRAGFDDATRRAQAAKLVRTDWAQPAIGAVSLSFARMLGAIGIVPASVGGHSFGEVTALGAAGVLSETDVLQVARLRGAAMAEASRTSEGAMVAVTAPIDRVRDALDASDEGVVVANHNAPEQVVLSGPAAAIDTVEERLRGKGLRVKRLDVATAFHSAVVAEAAAPFRKGLDDITLGVPRIPVFANETAAPYPEAEEAIRDRLAHQLVSSVRFVEQIEAMYEAGARVFVEVGPGSVLTGLVTRILGDRPHRAIPLDRKGRHGISAWHEALARLVVAGVPMDLSALWRRYARPEDPREASAPKMTLGLTGTNYGKPYPPPGGAAALPPPNPVSTPAGSRHAGSPPAGSPPAGSPAPGPELGFATPPVSAAATASPSSPSSPSSPGLRASRRGRASEFHPEVNVTDDNHYQNGHHIQPHFTAPSPAPATHATASGWAANGGAASGWAAAYQETQRHTAEAHAAFQNAMAQAHMAFLHGSERAVDGLVAMATGGAIAGPVVPLAGPAPAPIWSPPAPVFQPAPVPPPPPAATPAPAPPPAAGPVSLNAPSAVPPGPGSAGLGPAHPAPAHPAPGHPPAAVSTRAVGPATTPLAPSASPVSGAASVAPTSSPDLQGPSVASAPETASAAPADAETLLLEVVADKTGYPSDMLSMDMSLEADLGIDSIKRVEILSAMMKRRPDLPQVDTKKMATLNTLGEIVAYMNDHIQGSAATTTTAVGGPTSPKARSAATP
ncbi:MAG: beta-ketoacyl synthase N-terminal-like domain-containing protein [Myxococcota bacterium]